MKLVQYPFLFSKSEEVVPLENLQGLYQKDTGAVKGICKSLSNMIDRITQTGTWEEWSSSAIKLKLYCSKKCQNILALPAGDSEVIVRRNMGRISSSGLAVPCIALLNFCAVPTHKRACVLQKCGCSDLTNLWSARSPCFPRVLDHWSGQEGEEEEGNVKNRRLRIWRD
jgi:hypothetical protein